MGAVPDVLSRDVEMEDEGADHNARATYQFPT
jgi:hypothetical protein